MDDTGPRVKSHLQLPSLFILCSCRKKIKHAMYNVGLRQQKKQIQIFISLPLQASQFCKSFPTHIVSLNSEDLLFTVLVYMQQQ